ncbi:unnamed protein product [Vitrella brassicaformis CCMP3155]|uniref:Potassium channel tetramerisation-type BTB domain-containing protein n=1 Tax=Vitrella brassicaformis (strain CCMP3155) TaxID=1169540 RepID=A0A0G4H649_VITBC|nr:unnamed protein product [Vitrella brassicaformis CCMP3155]|eukprot:CEM39301.1 unnamed protein product [Vitrella brassicaformis CCMP3155]
MTANMSFVTATSAANSRSKQADKPFELNVGGCVRPFPREVLLRDGLKDTRLAVLLHRFDEWLLKDTDGATFIDADPFYFIWLARKLRYLITNHIDVAEIHAGCSAFAFYHERFMAKTALTIEAHEGDEDSEAFHSFMEAIGGFIKSSAGGQGGCEVLSVCVNGTTEATTDATLDDHRTFNDRFTKYAAPVTQVPTTTFDKVVDFVRRRRLSPDAVPPLPITDDWPQLLRTLEMYDLMELVYLSMIGKSHSHIRCLFRDFMHGGSHHEALFKQVGGADGGLLFVIQPECETSEDRPHAFACHIDGPLIAPTDPTAEVFTGRVITFYSITGAFSEDDGIVKIAVPHDRQYMTITGAEGVVKCERGGGGYVAIGGGRLWLGWGQDGRPIDDIRSCRQWVNKDDLPTGKTYVGSFTDDGDATLAGSQTFTAQRLEVYQVWTTRAADPILSGAQLQELINMTGNTTATGRPLYKGERDGWMYPTMVAKVGTASNLLLVIKDVANHVIACHINGTLKQPADAAGVQTTRCPVALYSVSGAFAEDGGIVEITVPHIHRRVEVAGTQGAIKAANGINVGNVCIGHGRLWLGFGGQDGRPAGDLRCCYQYVRRAELPAGKTYVDVGSFTDDRWATLAAARLLTCADMEVYALQQASGGKSTGSG